MVVVVMDLEDRMGMMFSRIRIHRMGLVEVDSDRQTGFSRIQRRLRGLVGLIAVAMTREEGLTVVEGSIRGVGLVVIEVTLSARIEGMERLYCKRTV